MESTSGWKGLINLEQHGPLRFVLQMLSVAPSSTPAHTNLRTADLTSPSPSSYLLLCLVSQVGGASSLPPPGGLSVVSARALSAHSGTQIMSPGGRTKAKG
jgi:hypothetical protein